ncbi:6-phosphogluconate dehydrogenase, NAD-binding [sediment metagenome]|uniref:6-phosphogluconate dehydrogenase, NAD-binding n=1 Tax=sediment metagenome TaxID=749907 RepID=D9PJS1_9ZZZZ
MKKIGIIGTGIMGNGMALNFLKNGNQVFVWNRTKSKTEKLTQQGAVVCKTPAETAKNADIVFEVTSDDKSSKQVWEGKNGIFQGADKSTVLIASSTLSIERTDQLAEKCRKKGLKFMDIPLTGGRIGAESGNLTLLCGGPKKTLKEITPELKKISAKIYHFGPEGHGMRYKLILNFLQSVHIIGFGQAMKLAKSSNMDLNKVSEALVEKPGGIITNISSKAYFKEPDPVTFYIKHLFKDLKYAKKFAGKSDLSLLDEVLKDYNKAVKKGFKDKDWASINTF